MAHHYTKEWKVDVSISSVNISFLKKFEFRDIFIGDQKGDTLIYAPSITTKIRNYSASRHFVNIRSIELNDPRIKISRYEGSEGFNYEFLEDYFASEETDTTPSVWKIGIDNIMINDGFISYQDFRFPKGPAPFDENSIHVSISTHLSDMRETKKGTVLNIESLRMEDVSGFKIRSLESSLVILKAGFALKDMKLKTNRSNLLASNLQLSGDSWNDFSEFIDKVKLSASVSEGSTLYLSDLAYFSENLNGADHKLELKGEVKGTVSRLKLRSIFLRYGGSYISGDFDFEGLPDINQTFLYFNIEELVTSKEELEKIKLPPFDGTNYLELPDNLSLMGEMTLKGNLTGFLTDFVAYADLKSDLGELSSDIEFRVHEETDNFHYRGRLMSNNFNVGLLYGIDEIGVVSADLLIDTAYGLNLDQLYASVHGNISKLHVHGYDYSNIKVTKGTFEKDYFIGEINVRDPNIYLDYNGKVDFSNKIPRYDFDVLVNDAFLGNLNLLSDPKDAVMCFNIKVDSTSGSNLDNFIGKIRVSDINYHDPDKDITMLEDITIRSRRTGHERRLEFESEIMNAWIAGAFSFENMTTSFQYMLSNIFPSLIEFDNDEFLSQSHDEFEFKIDIFDLSTPALILDKNLSVTPPTTISGNYNSRKDEIEILIKSSQIIYDDNYINDFTADIVKEGEFMYLNLDADLLVIQNKEEFHDVHLGLRPFRSRMGMRLTWENSATSYGDFNGDAYFDNIDEIQLVLDSCEFSMITQEWTIDPGSVVKYDSSDITIETLRLWTVDSTDKKRGPVIQELMVNGSVSKNPEESLLVEVNNFQLKNLTPILSLDGDSIQGEANGSANLSDLYGIPILISDIRVDSFKYNSSFVGNINFSSSWNTEESYMGFKGNLDRGEYKSFGFLGTYHIHKEKDNLDFTITFDETDLGVIDEFLPSNDISDFHAYASGKISVKGEPDNPQFSGNLSVIDGQIRVNYLNTKYYFGGDIIVEPNSISLQNMPISDEETHLLDLFPNGSLSGKLTHDNFSTESLNYNFRMDFDRLMLLNTTYVDNPLFYGIVYASGKVNVKNKGELIDIIVEESVAEKGTRFNLPLYGADEVVLQNFIKFVGDEKEVDDFKVDLENIRLNMSLDVTDDAEILILFDPAIGDIMSGAAKGHLDIEISELGEFLMYGELEVVRGDYLFTMYNVINKRFEVAPGGTIKWLSGSPYDAIIDLNTIYTTKAPLYNLVLLEDEKYKRKTVVECYMNLKNDLYNPELAFDIKIPKGDQNSDAALSKLRANNEEMTKQFFSLLVINNFVSSQSSGYGSYALSATTADLLNNQLSNWLSQLSDDVDLGFHYTPGDNLSQKEIAFAFETQLLNERLLISGNFGGSQGTTVSNTGWKPIGDFNIEYKINEDGTFRIKGFNETNDDDLTNISNSRYTQGVGVYYTEDFDKVGELKIVKSLKRWFSKKDTTSQQDTSNVQINIDESGQEDSDSGTQLDSLINRNLIREDEE